MYLPQAFREDRPDALRAFVRAHNFATLVTTGRAGLIASHIPMVLDDGPGPYGTLRGHLARGNPQWREWSAEAPALVIFSGPHHYISPNWYPSKGEHGRVVPTWNYSVVHAYGLPRIFEDRELLRCHVSQLTRQHDPAWRVEDAPAEFIDGMLGAIVGVEIPIHRLEGKWKLSQNRPEADRIGALEGLRRTGEPEALAVVRAMEDLYGRE